MEYHLNLSIITPVTIFTIVIDINLIMDTVAKALIILIIIIIIIPINTILSK